MSSPSKTSRLKSWIAPKVTWTTIWDAFVIVISADDRDLVEFISNGIFHPHLLKTKGQIFAADSFQDGTWSLNLELNKVIRDRNRLKSSDRRYTAGGKVKAFFGGAFSLPDAERVALIVSLSAPFVSGSIPIHYKVKAAELLTAHEKAKKEFDTKWECERREIAELFSHSDEDREKLESVLKQNMNAQRPILNAKNILADFIPRLRACRFGTRGIRHHFLDTACWPPLVSGNRRCTTIPGGSRVRKAPTD
jgi:hypothetical protein